MSNIVQIKRGVTTPKQGHLAPYELGYVTLYDNSGKENNNPDAGYLFIGDRNQNPQKIKADYADSAATATKATEADSAATATKADSATNAINAENANKIKKNNNEYITFADMLNLIYPIGSIYISVNDIDPSGLFGGTWEQLTETFLFAASTIGKSNPTYPANGNSYNTAKNGEATHTLTVKEIPSHRHTISRISKQVESGTSYSRITLDGTELSYTNYTGGDENGNTVPHNNMPPYLTVYMWKRIA